MMQRTQHQYVIKLNNVLSNLQPDNAIPIVIPNGQYNMTTKFGEACEFHAMASLSTYNVRANTSSEEKLLLTMSDF